MSEREFTLGMIGLGVMGRNLVLNIADHGYAVAGYDKDVSKVQALRMEAEGRGVRGAESLEEFVGLLRTPRTVMMLVPAGPPVDSVIRDVLPHLEAGDLIIDGGNSYFKDTNLRGKTLADKGILYLGVGISGGEHGARRPQRSLRAGAAHLRGGSRSRERRAMRHLPRTPLGRSLREDDT
jgi:6-phosphogluconate dehydrogenase